MAGWRTPLAAWVVSRALVMAALVAGSLLLGEPDSGTADGVPRALALAGGWDTVWYLDIARDGYARDPAGIGAVPTDAAFFPGVPLIAAGAAWAGLNPFLSVLAVSNLAFLGALAGLHALVRARAGDAAARYAVWALALLPTAMVASLAYGEGIVLALAVLAALAASRGRWATAALVAGAAPILRAPAMLVPLLVSLTALRAPGRRRPLRAVLVALPGVAVLAAWLAWMWAARGSPLLPFRAQEAWGGRPVIGWVTAAPEWVPDVVDLVSLRMTADAAVALRDIGFGALYAALLVRLWRREGGIAAPPVAYSLACLALPLTTFGPTALSRYGLLAFPLAWSLGDWVREHPRTRIPLIAAAAPVTVALVALLAMRSP